MAEFPVTVTQAGAQPIPPAELLEKLITSVAAKVPGYTANLPPALITDLASTATGALALIDSAMVDLINSVTPYGANIPLLNQLGTIYGIPRGIGINTSVTVIFTGSLGFVIPRGFIVPDGNHQYAVQSNSITATAKAEEAQKRESQTIAPASLTFAIILGSLSRHVCLPVDSIDTINRTARKLYQNLRVFVWTCMEYQIGTCIRVKVKGICAYITILKKIRYCPMPLSALNRH